MSDDDVGRWSDGRHKQDLDPNMRDIIKCKDSLDSVDSVLLLLSKDDDLHDDLKLPIVNVAINHWTVPDKRLPPEKARKLQENKSVLYVLEKIQLLQHVSKLANIPVPLNHMLTRQTQLDIETVKKSFGFDVRRIHKMCYENDNNATTTTTATATATASSSNNNKEDTNINVKEYQLDLNNSSNKSSSKNSSSIFSVENIVAVILSIIATLLIKIFVIDNTSSSSNDSATNNNNI